MKRYLHSSTTISYHIPVLFSGPRLNVVYFTTFRCLPHARPSVQGPSTSTSQCQLGYTKTYVRSNYNLSYVHLSLSISVRLYVDVFCLCVCLSTHFSASVYLYDGRWGDSIDVSHTTV